MDIISFNEASTANGRIETFIENPDSTSGILTVPKVIASGETITIPTGRVAVLPNVQVDGTLNIEGDVFIPSGATFSKVVETEGNQTIDGIKTFVKSPIVPTPTTGTQAVNKDYVDSKPTLPIGAILNAYTIFDNCIVAFGGEFNRADYPRLWAYLQANPTLVKTQAEWTAESTANGGICGFFSAGNGTTTFRVPNLDKAFLRADSRTVGSYQGDAFQQHNHKVYFTTSSSIITSTRTPSEPGNESVWSNPFTRNNTATDVYAGEEVKNGDNPLKTDALETRPKNIAVLPLIVAK